VKKFIVGIPSEDFGFMEKQIWASEWEVSEKGHLIFKNSSGDSIRTVGYFKTWEYIWVYQDELEKRVVES
jgi:hypothetical protein